jgi:hypothetical protein
MPLTTTPSTSVAAGTIQPPGHMQNENTPRGPPGPSVVWASRYGAALSRGWPAAPPYCDRSISACGCSMRTPTANGLAASATPASTSSGQTSRAEWPVATTTARPVSCRPSANRTPATRRWPR